MRPEADSFGSELTSLLGPIMDHLGPLAFAGLVAGAAVGALSIGEKFEDAFHKIQDLTGATGLKILSLGASFNTVFSSTPGANFTNTAEAIGLVSQRTGLANSALDTLSSKFIELAKITGTDVATDITTATGLFSQFGVTAANQAGQLDVLYKAARDAGVGFGQFASDMKTAAPTAQTLGLNIDQTAAIISNLDKLGLPASKTMLALGTAFSKAAKAGKDPTSVIADMIGQIQKAPNATAATTEAIVKFGLSARSAATFVDSVRSGTFKFGATLKDITDGKGGITDTAFATMSLGDRFNLLKNKALVALEPIAMKATELANTFLTELPKAFAIVSKAWDDLVGGFQNPDAKIGPAVSTFERVFLTIGADAAKGVKIAKDAWAELTSFIGGHTSEIKVAAVALAGILVALKGYNAIEGVQSKLAGLGSTFDRLRGKASDLEGTFRDSAGKLRNAEGQFVDDSSGVLDGILSPAGLVIGAIALLGVAFYEAYEHIKPFHDWVNKVAGILKTDFLDGLRVVGGFLRTDVLPVLEKVPGELAKLWSEFTKSEQVKGIIAELRNIWVDMQPVISWMVDHWKLLAVAMATVAAPVAVLVGGAILLYAKFKPVREVVDGLASVLGKVFVASLRVVGDVIKDTLKVFDGLLKVVTGLFTLNWSKVGEGFSEIGSAILDALGSVVSNLGGLLLSGLKAAFHLAASKGPTLIVDLVKFFVGLNTRLLAGVGDLGVKLVSWAWDGFKSLASKLPQALGFVAGFFVALPFKLVLMMGDATKWLVQKGLDIVAGLVVGLVDNLPAILKFVNGLPGRLLGWLVHADVWLVDTGTHIVVGLVTGLVAAVPKIDSFVAGIPTAMIKAAGDVGKWLYNMGGDVLAGLYKGVQDAIGGVSKIIGKIKDGFVNGLKSAFGISSPSKVTYQHGQWIAQGLALGISDNAHLVTDALGALPGIKAGSGGRLQLDVTGLPHGLNGPAGAGNLTDKIDKTNEVLTEMLGVVKQSGAPDPYAGAGSAQASFPTGTSTLAQTNPRGLRSRQRQIAATRPR